MAEDNQNKPQSLFGDNDIRHSLETVNERWEREKSRRIRLATKIALPIALVLLAAWLITAKIFTYFPFYPVYIIEEEEETETPAKAEENKAPAPVEKMGNEEAQVKLYVGIPKDPGKIPDTFLAILHEATDTKPSQIYVEVWKEENAPYWLRDAFHSGMKMALTIGSTEPMEPVDTDSKLINLINDQYSMTYKDDRLVINPATYGLKQPTEEDLKIRAQKRIERENAENIKLPSLKFER